VVRLAEDADLITRAQRGDDDAYGMLVERYQTIAFRTAWLVCGDAAEAEDVAQEAFLKAHAALGRFRSGAPWRPWLLRIVANEARNAHRSSTRRTAREDRSARLMPAELIDPSVEVVDRDARERLLAAVDSLPDKLGHVVVCRYLLDLDEAATAVVLGVPRGTVKSRLSRGLARLREDLATTTEEVDHA